MGRSGRFSPEVRERAVRMVEEHREAHASAEEHPMSVGGVGFVGIERQRASGRGLAAQCVGSRVVVMACFSERFMVTQPFLVPSTR